MTSPTPTGRLVPTAGGHDLVLTRRLPGSLRDAWASLTEPERTARWFGRWEGTGTIGATVRVQLGFEDEAPWADAEIRDCEPPHRLRIVMVNDHGSWDLAADLREVDGQAELQFVMHRVDPAAAGEVGPGWEWYLDLLVAAMSGAPQPSFDDYFPAQRAHYEAQAT